MALGSDGCAVARHGRPAADDRVPAAQMAIPNGACTENRTALLPTITPPRVITIASSAYQGKPGHSDRAVYRSEPPWTGLGLAKGRVNESGVWRTDKARRPVFSSFHIPGGARARSPIRRQQERRAPG